MSWRLGTWSDEKLFVFLDELLGYASTLKNWEDEKSLLQDCTFEQYWSLLWQLQVARMLDNAGVSLSWCRPGPDLRAVIGGAEFWVECYVYRKSFGIQEFVLELLQHLDVGLAVDHDLYVPHSLLKDSELRLFLDSLFRPLLDNSYIKKLRERARRRYPVPVDVPGGITNFFVYMQGENPAAYDPSIHRFASGVPEAYLEVAFREAINSKLGANKLNEVHPNLLAVNFVLSPDFQTAFERQRVLRSELPEVDLGSEIDAVILSACGVDRIPSCQESLAHFRERAHPARLLFS